MFRMYRCPLLVVLPLCVGLAEAAILNDPTICYVLDGILFVYGIILTALFCRMKIQNAREEAQKNKSKGRTEEGVYTGLTPRVQDTYETIGMRK